MAVGGVRHDAVRVGRLLPVGLRAGARVLPDPAGRSEAAIRLDGQAGNAACAVVGNQHDAARAVQRNVGRACAAGGLHVEQGEVARRTIHGISRNSPAARAPVVANLAHSIQPRAIRRTGQEGRIGQLRGQTGDGQRTAGRIQFRPVDAPAARPIRTCVAGPRADQDPQLIILARHVLSPPCRVICHCAPVYHGTHIPSTAHLSNADR